MEREGRGREGRWEEMSGTCTIIILYLFGFEIRVNR